MACCQMALSHYLNQSWLNSNGILWHVSESNFAESAQEFNPQHLPVVDELNLTYIRPLVHQAPNAMECVETGKPLCETKTCTCSCGVGPMELGCHWGGPDGRYRWVFVLTLKWLGHFFNNVISFRNVIHHKCDIFYMKLIQYNERLVSIVDTDGLLL